MSLLDEAIAAHGGLDRWKRLSRFTVKTSIGGALFDRKGKNTTLADITVDGATDKQYLRITGLGRPDRRGVYTPDRVWLETLDGTIVDDRPRPFESFAGQTAESPWDDLHVLYFSGYANWNDLVAPFVLAEPGFVVEEAAPWKENGETWRRLKVTFPDTITTHSAEQIFFFDDRGLVRRHDYWPRLTGGVHVAHYCDGHQTFDGIVVPTIRKALRVDETGQPQTPAAVTIKIASAHFE